MFFSEEPIQYSDRRKRNAQVRSYDGGCEATRQPTVLATDDGSYEIWTELVTN